ncbi:protein DpdG [Thalassotalea crassostreae]|uniref:protein DpdG n=1 Tax=Thalassotalea crassostreae TaxID=1763536 RepID=UPI000838CB11|nr:protein DpdG [Thalassotalea crassostreae]
MALINNASPESQINLLCLIYRVLYRNPNKFNQDELYEVCRPESIFRAHDQIKRFKGNLNFWNNDTRQLWDVDNDGKYYLLEKYETEPDISTIANDVYRKLFRVTDSECIYDTDFLNNKNNKIAPIYRTLAFVLSTPIFAPPLWSKGSEIISSDSLDNYLGSYFQEYRLNDSEKSYFLEFAHFLGFVEVQDKTSQYIADPTRAILPVLPLIFANTRTLPIKDFIIKLASLIPVLDEGYYRIEVEKIMSKGPSMKIESSKFSRSLSHALCRLQALKIINFPPSKSDDKNIMSFSSLHNKPSVSEIRYMPGAV